MSCQIFRTSTKRYELITYFVTHSIMRKFQCKNAGHDIQENVLRSLYELQHNNKVLQKSQSNYENASKKQHDIRKEVEKIEKETKPEKLDKNKKYQEKKKSLGIKQDRLEKAVEEAAQVQI